jgi:O-antigen ligase
MTETRASDRFAWPLLALGLIVPWWLPWLSQPIVTFYKEWICVVALGFAGLAFAPLAGDRIAWRRQPMLAAALAVVALLVVQSVLLDGVWRKAVLTAASVGFFIFTLLLGRSLWQRRGEDSLLWLGRCLIAAALGSCLFAALQLTGLQLPFVLVRMAERVYGNVAQANHFADLLWLGCVATVLLFAWGRLRAAPAIATVAVLQAFCVFSGSRMVWVFAAVTVALGLACRARNPAPTSRRFGAALIAVGVAQIVVSVAVSASGALDAFGIASAEQRMESAGGKESTAKRLWFWRAGLDAAVEHPLLGVGVGRFSGHALELSMQTSNGPRDGADTQAHNVFIQIAAELGLPLALFVAACLALWLAAAWRRAREHPIALGILALAAPILIHANLEHPLAYLNFLGLLGLLIGHVPERDPEAPADAVADAVPSNALRFASFAVLVGAMAAYVQYGQVERAMQVLQTQASKGVVLQPSQPLAARLAAIPAWSAFGDYAELMEAISSVPTPANAAAFVRRCDRAVTLGPTAHLLARCATASQVAGNARRATYLANALCTLYPDSANVLIESMLLVERSNTGLAELNSRCVDRVK